MQLIEAPTVVVPLIKTAIKGKVISDVIKGVSGVVKQGVKTTGDVAKTATSAAGTALSAAQKVGKAISGREKTASQKKIIKTGGIKAARDMDGDGKLEKKRSGGEFQETLLYDVVHDYIIAENFASNTEGANKVMLKLSDELMQEIYERTMTASEKRKDTMLKKKYDDSDMKKNMQGQYGKEEGKKVYFATIRKQAMKKEEVEVVTELSKKTLGSYVKKASQDMRNQSIMHGAEVYRGKSFDVKGKYKPEKIADKRQQGIKKATDKLTKEEVGIATHSMMMKDKAKKEAMLRMKERDAVAKKLRKEEVKRDEYGDPIGSPKISKKQLKKNLAANAPDEDHTNTTAEGYGSDRVGPALKVARAIDKVNPRPKPNSKRTAMSRALKMASIKKDEKIRKRKENPYSTDKKLKMVATSIRDRVKQKVKSMAASENYIPEEGYDIARDMGRVPKTKGKKDATTMPPSKEMMKTQKVNKGPSALELVKKKYGKSVMGTKK